MTQPNIANILYYLTDLNDFHINPIIKPSLPYMPAELPFQKIATQATSKTDLQPILQ